MGIARNSPVPPSFIYVYAGAKLVLVKLELLKDRRVYVVGGGGGGTGGGSPGPPLTSSDTKLPTPALAG